MSNGMPSLGEGANIYTGLVQDKALAEQMAVAAAPFYGELHAARGNLSAESFRLSPQQMIERMSPYYIRIGMAMEGARRDIVGVTASQAIDTVDTEPMIHAETSPDALLAAARGPSFAETRSSLFEQNVGILKETVSGIFDMMRGEDWVHTEKSTNSDTGAYAISEMVSLYDPYTGIMSTVGQSVEHARDGAITLKGLFIHDEFVPIPVGPPPKNRKDQARLLVNGRRMIFDEVGYDLLEKFSDDKERGVEDKDPDFVAEWSTRLLRSTPVSLEDTRSVLKDYKSDYVNHVVLSKYTKNTVFGVIYSKGIERHLEGEWLAKLSTNHQRYEELKRIQAPELYPS